MKIIKRVQTGYDSESIGSKITHHWIITPICVEYAENGYLKRKLPWTIFNLEPPVICSPMITSNQLADIATTRKEANIGHQK